MYDYRGFGELKVGQRLKVKGTPAADGKSFTALEIALKEQKDQAEIEGLVQGVDPSTSTLRIANMDIVIPTDAVVKNTSKMEIDLGDLREGDVVKVKGPYHASSKFVPEKVKMKESMGFNIEELQGTIDQVDEATHTFAMIGVQVVVTEKTSIEG